MADDDERADIGLGFKVAPEIADRLTALQDAVRSEGHHRPSNRVVVSALIYGAPQDGEKLETDVLAPFRKAYPSESRD